MYRIQLRGIDGSVHAALPEELVEHLHASDGDVLYALERNGEIILAPYDPEFNAVMEAYDEIRRTFGNALRELAKS